jgi:hypothetical protein
VKLGPTLAREAEAGEEPRLGSTDGVLRVEQVVPDLGRGDPGSVQERQRHQERWTLRVLSNAMRFSREGAPSYFLLRRFFCERRAFLGCKRLLDAA